MRRAKSTFRSPGARSNRPQLLYYRNKPKSIQSIKTENTRQKKNPLQILASGIVVVIITFILMYALSLDTKTTVSFQSKSNLLQKTSVYTASAERLLKETPLSRSKLTINTSQLASEIERLHPEIANATVVIPFFTRQPRIILTPIMPAFIENSGNNSFVVDQFGVAVARVQELTNISSLELVTINDDADLNVQKGKAVFSEEQTNFIKEVIEQLKSKNIPIASITIPISAYDLSIRLKNKPYVIKMNMIGDARSQVGRFLAAEKEATKAGRGVNEYIDVRVEERAYIK